MEALVVSNETALTLKAAGFPQTTAWAFVAHLNTATGWVKYYLERRGKDEPEEYVAAPTLQDIFDELPKQCSVGSMYTSGYEAYYAQKKPFIRVDGATAVETLALLWLTLREVQP